jgi:hypothetical protein
MLVGFMRVSENKKTGPIPTSMTEQSSCPDACPWKEGKLCYPFFSPLGFQWESLTNGGYYGTQTFRSSHPISWDDFCSKISELPRYQLWRHNTAGDLPGAGDEIDTQALQQLINANRKARAFGFTYTHKPVTSSPKVSEWLALRNARAVYACNQSGFTVNVSADSLCEADELYDLAIGPVVVVVETDAPRRQVTPKGRIVVVCPAEEKGIQCDRCRLCANNDRKAIIAFRAHGTRRNKVNKHLKVLNNIGCAA